MKDNQLHSYSVATVRLNCLTSNKMERIARATGFFLKFKEKTLLITNDHVVSGLGHGDRKVLSETGAIPSWLQVVAQMTTNPGFSAGQKSQLQKVSIFIPLYKDMEKCLDPLWVSHPTLGHKVDVVAIKLTGDFKTSHGGSPAALEFSADPKNYRAMERVFVVGFPLDEHESPNPFPIYKSASIATEPDFLGERPFVLIDGKTKSGMSGSPVVLEHTPAIEDSGDGTMSFRVGKTELIGVYSGRESEDPTTFEAELGLMWPYEQAIKPILESI